MCFIVSVILLILSFNFFSAGSFLLSGISFSVSMVFLYFMIKNIKHVKKLREGKKNVN